MKSYGVKVIILHVFAMLSGAIPIIGCYPLAVSFYAAMHLQDRYRYTIYPAILVGMLLTAEPMQIVHYGITMLLIVLLAGILENRRIKRNRYTQGLLAGASLVAMSYAEGAIVLLAVGEAMLIFSLTVLFHLLLQNYMSEIEITKPEIVHGPGKMKMMESAEVFDRLAECFDKLPAKQERFSRQDLERMSKKMNTDFCTKCSKCLECWQKNQYDTLETTAALFTHYEEYGTLQVQDVRGRMAVQCIRLHAYINEMKQVFEKARTNLFWYNRLIENRAAVAGQLSEMANMMNLVAADIYDNTAPESMVEDLIRRRMKRARVMVEKVSVTKKRSGKQELFLTMYTKGGRMIATREIGHMISEIVGKKMVPHISARRVLAGEPMTVAFVEDTQYRVCQGIARAVKPGALISGDNETFLVTEDGQAVGCISDGMGSGVLANQESEQVIELLERFLEAGFAKETAIRMINSTMLLTDGEPNCSTIDVCSIDLFSGLCEFLKLGATVSFVRHENWVEVLRSEELPIGVVHQNDFCKSQITLVDGEYVILVSDGVLEAVAEGDGKQETAENIMEDLILKQFCTNPKEMANKLLTHVLSRCKYNPPDDLTIMVLGVFQKQQRY